ncbi:MAG: hypothetical protein IPN49_16625 [Saprospiraceae bacterium]|nr:hypothetical protein [Saprospiraceae bacterium]
MKKKLILPDTFLASEHIQIHFNDLLFPGTWHIKFHRLSVIKSDVRSHPSSCEKYHRGNDIY